MITPIQQIDPQPDTQGTFSRKTSNKKNGKIHSFNKPGAGRIILSKDHSFDEDSFPALSTWKAKPQKHSALQLSLPRSSIQFPQEPQSSCHPFATPQSYTSQDCRSSPTQSSAIFRQSVASSASSPLFSSASFPPSPSSQSYATTTNKTNSANSYSDHGDGSIENNGNPISGSSCIQNCGTNLRRTSKTFQPSQIHLNNNATPFRPSAHAVTKPRAKHDADFSDSNSNDNTAHAEHNDDFETKERNASKSHGNSFRKRDRFSGAQADGAHRRSNSAPENHSLTNAKVSMRNRDGKKEHFVAMNFKTEMCRSFLSNGSCEYELECQFAHGLHELRPRHFGVKYKTQSCKNYHTDKHCRFGSRCKFIHDECRVQVSDNEFWLVSPSEALIRVEIVENPQRKSQLQQLCESSVVPPAILASYKVLADPTSPVPAKRNIEIEVEGEEPVKQEVEPDPLPTLDDGSHCENGSLSSMQPLLLPESVASQYTMAHDASLPSFQTQTQMYYPYAMGYGYSYYMPETMPPIGMNQFTSDSVHSGLPMIAMMTGNGMQNVPFLVDQYRYLR